MARVRGWIAVLGPAVAMVVVLALDATLGGQRTRPSRSAGSV
ncbi:hypothetical protein ACXDF8_23190 [Mycolicibacterium sp. CBM1]